MEHANTLLPCGIWKKNNVVLQPVTGQRCQEGMIVLLIFFCIFFSF